MDLSYSTYSVQLATVLLLIAAAVAMTVRWIKVPYSIALVIVGLIIGATGLLPAVHMTPGLILLVFLPPLLFEASFSLDAAEVKRNWLPITVLATIGVVVNMLISAGIVHLGGLDWQSACLFGAMMAATDPISVLAIFRKMGIEKRLIVLLEGESLFNDGTAVVLFSLVLAAVMQGNASLSVPAAALSFIVTVVAGTAIGALIGWLASKLTRYFDDHLLETLLTVVTAYGAYLIADRLHVSSVLAVVAAGMMIGNLGRAEGMSESTRESVDHFWEFAAFVVNSLVFLLIGLQVRVELLVRYAPLIGLGVAAVLAARAVVVYGLAPFVSTRKLPIPYSWRAMLFWGALRGALSIAMGMSLPLALPGREPLVVLTYGTVLFTLLVPGLTSEPLIRVLKLEKKEDLQEPAAISTVP